MFMATVTDSVMDLQLGTVNGLSRKTKVALLADNVALDALCFCQNHRSIAAVKFSVQLINIERAPDAEHSQCRISVVEAHTRVGDGAEQQK